MLPDKHRIWNQLEAHARSISEHRMNDFYQMTSDREARFQETACGITLDFSKQRITSETLDLLCDLADSCQLKQKIDDLMSGKKINVSENRPALHTALRVMEYQPLWVDGHDVMADVFEARNKMEVIAGSIRSGSWLGCTGQPIADVVNIGMGGSDLGAKFCLNALTDYVSQDLQFHFISDADPDIFERTIAKLNPETTLFIVSSKSFTTGETLFNAQKAMHWIGDSNRFKQHFIAITAQTEKAYAHGIKNVLPIWDWVGGRYSVCSAVNLITMIAIGPMHFKEFLSGAHAMDEHFKHTPLRSNLPVLMALLGVWNNNFNGIQTLLMLVYSNRLEQLVAYVQQLDMESNGKCTDRDGHVVSYATGPIVWGGHGNRAQHSYYQLLCQGTHRVAIDFISIKCFDGSMVNAFCKAKQKVVAYGVPATEEDENKILGHTPCNHFCLEQSSPYTLGALVSLYEHKIYTQGVVWNINSFDQPGVELAKKYQAELSAEDTAI
ncbi:MAG: glucose-6-phosphate isomerase [Gammaproteobacteria bacterium]|nr:glucose-6-phosphate isomerase [Gammaproteobacteria bacterium]